MGGLQYSQRKLIGGEFEFDCIPGTSKNGLKRLIQSKVGTWTTSGRAALYLILQNLKSIGVSHVHLPAFLCESILQPVKALELDYSFYPVQLDLTAQPDPPKNSAVLLIHYFGCINKATDSLREDSGKDYYLIEDASHVFLNKDYFLEDGIQFVFFSTRKHGPTVLGGWCNLDMDLENPSKDIDLYTWKSLAARMIKGMYLIESDEEVDQSTESFYLELFRELEVSLDSDIYPTKPPKIVLDIIDGLDWEEISRRRRDNWQALDDIIEDKVERFSKELTKGNVPLGYVIRHKNRNGIREKLAKHRIFAPVHWPLPNEINRKRFPNSVALSDSLLTIPIDQRYSQDDITYLADVLKTIA